MAHLTRDIVVVGTSAGGVQALQTLVAGLPANFPAAVCVVLHTWPGAESYLAPILMRAGQLPAVQPKDGDRIIPGKIYVAPSDHHLLLEEGRITVVRGPRENRFRPAINPLFRSAAAAYRNRVIGVVLTGMLDDGAAGLWAIKRCGGLAVVQSDAEFEQMPNAALNNVEVDYNVPLSEIPPLLDRLVREPVKLDVASDIPDIIRVNDEGAKMKPNEFAIDGVGRRSVFSCPECNGALWELEEGRQLEYRCHVGHAYSAEALREAQSSALERSLWSALRALKESAELDDRLARRSEAHGLTSAAAVYAESAKQKQSHADQMQEFMGRMRFRGGTDHLQQEPMTEG
jgi:two-component system chemotaxis response regulator CheB